MTDSPCCRTSFTCSRIVSTASSALTLVKPVSSAMRLTISTFLIRSSRSHHADVAVIHTEWRKGVTHFRVASNNRLICISLTTYTGDYRPMQRRCHIMSPSTTASVFCPSYAHRPGQQIHAAALLAARSNGWEFSRQYAQFDARALLPVAQAHHSRVASAGHRSG